MRRALLSLFIAAAALAQSVTDARGNQVASAFPTGQSETINLVKWEGNQLPRVYERSSQLPLTDEEISKLSHAGFDAPQLVKMIEERRCACDASADGLIRLKEQGVNKDVLSAISLHALPPNRQLNFLVTLDFAGSSNTARESYVYVFVDDGPVTRVLSVSLNDLLRQRNLNESMVDQSDLLLPKQVRRIQLPGSLPLLTYGKHTVMVVASGNPAITHPSQLKDFERKNAQSYTFDYPRSSIQKICRLNAGYLRDPVLAYKWNYVGSRFECEWN